MDLAGAVRRFGVVAELGEQIAGERLVGGAVGGPIRFLQVPIISGFGGSKVFAWLASRFSADCGSPCTRGSARAFSCKRCSAVTW